MKALVLKDITVELANQLDNYPTEITNLRLEISIGGAVLGKVNLLSLESTTGIWKTDRRLFLPANTGAMISIFTEASGNDCQPIGSKQLNKSELHQMIGKQCEIPLTCRESYPGLIFKTNMLAVDITRGPVQNGGQTPGQAGGPSYNDDAIGKLLANAHLVHQDFQRYGKLQVLEQAILQWQTAIKSIPQNDPRMPLLLHNLGVCLQDRFNRLGYLEDIHEAIERHQTAVKLTSDDDPERTSRLNSLGNAFQLRFERLGHEDDLDNSILQKQMAVDLAPDGHPHKPTYLNNLGTSLQFRFTRRKDPVDLDNAIILLQRSVDITPDSDPSKPRLLNNLGSTLEGRFTWLGDVADIDNAVTQLRTAVHLTPDGDPNKPMRLSNLGGSLLTRFERFGDIADLDGAISQQQITINSIPDGHPSKPGCLSNLGTSLKIRFQRLGDLADLDNAITLQQEAVELMPEGHAERPALLNNLGTSLGARFRRLGNISDINLAILHERNSVSLIPDNHPDKPSSLTNLGSSLYTRFQRLGNPDDINDAITQQQIAVNITPDIHSNKAVYLSNLGLSLKLRFKRLGSLVDLDNAVMHHEKAVYLTSDGHPNKAGELMNLGISFRVRFHHLHHVSDAESAIKHLSAATLSSVGPPTTRFQAAQLWISTASSLNHASLLSAYESALDLVPLVAWLGLPIANRHEHLMKIGGVAREAAAAAISTEQYDKALEWLEQGRSIVWTQILQLRTPVDQLQEVNPNLADRLLLVSQQLDRGIQQSNKAEGIQQTTEEEGRQYRALTAERESIIQQVRSLPGFEDFLRPPRSSKLKNAAQNGPVVIFNIAKARCDALALLSDSEDVIHIPLQNTSSTRQTELQEELKGQLYSSGIRTRGERAAKKVEEGDEGSCRQVLAELWNNLVKPVLDTLALHPHPDILPRIWWCATGPLAFLPIHAAGIYDPGSEDSQLSNYAISSYTPTLSALLEPLKPQATSPFSLLSVIQPTAPGASSIPNTQKELEYIRSHLTGRSYVVLEGPEGTKRRVTKAMEECNWVHLACHGIQVPEEPTKSALLLEDGHLTLEEIIKLDLPQAEFAFLSACQTTTGDESLSEEAVHIAGAMLLAGYRGVVATMWSIQDELAPLVTDEFYAQIMEEGGRPYYKKAAEALHISVQKLRKQPGIDLTDWIPFVHLGV